MIGPGAMPRSRTFPRPNDRCTGGARGNQIAPRERDRRTDRGRRRRGSRRNARTKKGQYEEGARGGEGARAGRKGRKGQRGATRAGNYMAFVSDGAFNDLSIPRRGEETLRSLRLSQPFASAPRRARARARALHAGKKPDARRRIRPIESSRSDRIRGTNSSRDSCRRADTPRRHGDEARQVERNSRRGERNRSENHNRSGIEARGSTRRGEAERDRPRV